MHSRGPCGRKRVVFLAGEKSQQRGPVAAALAMFPGQSLKRESKPASDAGLELPALESSGVFRQLKCR